MKYVEIKGGLGNQMFQYCFSKYLEQKYDSDVALHLDFFDYVKKVPQATVRQFDLDKMQTNYISVKGSLICQGIVEEELFDDHVENYTTEFYSGYWQDKKYFEYVKDELCSDFHLKDKFITEDIRKTVCLMEESNSVSLHIRRTDYLTGLNADIFSALDMAYYMKAIDIVSELAGRDVKIFVFSDDPGFAMNFMKSQKVSTFEIMPIREAFQDIYLMAETKHHIIANSSFSWWAAALSSVKEKNGITIAPAEWYKGKPSPNLYLDGWNIV